MEIEFDGTYDRAAFIKALQMIEKRTLLQNAIRWLALPLLLFSLGVGIYQWIDEGAGVNGLVNLARPVFIAMLLGIYYVGPYLSRRSRTNSLFKDKPVRRMRGKAGPEGITVMPSQGEGVLFGWERFIRRKRQDPLLALLMVDGTLALFKRDFFQREGDWSRFVELVERRVIEPK